MDADKIKSIATEVLTTEARALEAVRGQLDDHFVRACNALSECQGHIVLTGIGKSGHIAGKIAATLSSTGNPAIYMHPADANHGDIGMLRDGDALVLLSYSGEADEIKSLLPAIKHLDVKIIAITGARESTLGRAADVCIQAEIDKEACPLGLAPTTSTTVMLAIGDCLAAVLLADRGFSNKDFAQTHPGGTLGRRLLLKLSDVMRHGDDVPLVNTDTTIADALFEISNKQLGMTLVTDGEENVVGIFTDGDLRRVINKGVDLSAPVKQVMNAEFHRLLDTELASDALHDMEERKINSAPVFDAQGRLVGALNLHDLLRAGI